MDFFAIFLFALSANLDNFTVAITYGMRRIRIGPAANLLIAGISGTGTCLCMSAGILVGRFLPHTLSAAAGSLILIGIGLWSIKSALRPQARRPVHEDGLHLGELLDSPEKADADASGRIDPREAVLLALALTINNAGLGLGASIAGLNIPLTTACTAVLSVALIRAGAFVGKKWASRLFGRFAPLAAGIFIAALGVYELLPAL